MQIPVADFGLDLAQREYGAEVYAARRRQLDSQEIRRLGLLNPQ